MLYMDGLSDLLQVRYVVFLMSNLRFTQFPCVLAAFGTGWTFESITISYLSIWL